jgi:hypothetical protein
MRRYSIYTKRMEREGIAKKRRVIRSMDDEEAAEDQSYNDR